MQLNRDKTDLFVFLTVRQAEAKTPRPGFFELLPFVHFVAWFVSFEVP